MGTRADFYVGAGLQAEWLGSFAWDGYPDGVVLDSVFPATSESEFRERIKTLFSARDDVTLPADGWPWPWDTSNTTDFAYCWSDGDVQVYCFGSGPIPSKSHNWRDYDAEVDWPGSAEFPDMSAKANLAESSDKSGIIMVSG